MAKSRSDISPELLPYFDAGYDGAKVGINLGNHYLATFGSSPVGGSDEWRAYLEGTSQWDDEVNADKAITYKVDEFMTKLKALCAEYDAKISSGCGCCGAGLTVRGDYEITLEVGGQS